MVDWKCSMVRVWASAHCLAGDVGAGLGMVSRAGRMGSGLGMGLDMLRWCVVLGVGFLSCGVEWSEGHVRWIWVENSGYKDMGILLYNGNVQKCQIVARYGWDMVLAKINLVSAGIEPTLCFAQSGVSEL